MLSFNYFKVRQSRPPEWQSLAGDFSSLLTSRLSPGATLVASHAEGGHLRTTLWAASRSAPGGICLRHDSRSDSVGSRTLKLLRGVPRAASPRQNSCRLPVPDRTGASELIGRRIGTFSFLRHKKNTRKKENFTE